jgi:hypothetical protein
MVITLINFWIPWVTAGAMDIPLVPLDGAGIRPVATFIGH